MGTFVEVKKLWFDPSPIAKEMDRKTIKVLGKFGAYTRRVAQSSMKTKKGHSPPGVPPYSHGNKYLKKFVFFVVDRKEKTVVVGPTRLSKYSDIHLPKVIEGGGRIAKRNRAGKPKIANHEPRPFMEPAAKKHYGQVAQWYAEL